MSLRIASERHHGDHEDYARWRCDAFQHKHRSRLCSVGAMVYRPGQVGDPPLPGDTDDAGSPPAGRSHSGGGAAPLTSQQEAHMEPTRSAPMLSLHVCDPSPRHLTAQEEARITRVLAPYPPIYRRRPKMTVVLEHVPTPPQPWIPRVRAA